MVVLWIVVELLAVLITAAVYNTKWCRGILE